MLYPRGRPRPLRGGPPPLSFVLFPGRLFPGSIKLRQSTLSILNRRLVSVTRNRHRRLRFLYYFCLLCKPFKELFLVRPRFLAESGCKGTQNSETNKTFPCFFSHAAKDFPECLQKQFPIYTFLIIIDNRDAPTACTQNRKKYPSK